MAKVGLLGLAALLAAGPAAAQGVGGDAEACAAGEPAIRVDVTGLKDRTGRLKLELYPANATDFLRDDRDLIKEGKTFRRVWANVPASGAVAMCIRVPRPGAYALFFTHDRDGKNKFNFWSDGGGTPGNAKIGRARPTLASATVNVGARPTTVTIRVQYLHGFPPSFSPLKN
jgi:uncharacterized protein (DUF2141 family)